MQEDDVLFIFYSVNEELAKSILITNTALLNSSFCIPAMIYKTFQVENQSIIIPEYRFNIFSMLDMILDRRLRSTIFFSTSNFFKKILFQTFLAGDYPVCHIMIKQKVLSSPRETTAFPRKLFLPSVIGLLFCLLDPVSSIGSCVGNAVTLRVLSSKIVFSSSFSIDYPHSFWHVT